MTLTCVNAQIWGLSQETSRDFSKIADAHIKKIALAPFNNMILSWRGDADNIHTLPKDSTYVRLQFIGTIRKDREIDPNRAENLIRNVFNKMNLDIPLESSGHTIHNNNRKKTSIISGTEAYFKFKAIK